MCVSDKQIYIPAYLPAKEFDGSSWALVFYNKKLLMRKSDGKFYIPKIKELDAIIMDDKSMEYIGTYDGHDCYCIRLKEEHELPVNVELVELMQITNLSGDAGLFLLAGTANHILHWNSMNQYCGCCGNITLNKTDERAKICPNCGNIVILAYLPLPLPLYFMKIRYYLLITVIFETAYTA